MTSSSRTGSAAALQSEADSLPFTLTADVLEIRLAARRRSACNQRLTFVAAAGLAVVAVGVGAFLFNRAVGRDGDGLAERRSPIEQPVNHPVWIPASRASRLRPSQASSSPPTPHPAASGAGLGAPNDAVIVTYVGDPLQPERIDVSLMTVDAGGVRDRSSSQRPSCRSPVSRTSAPGYQFDTAPPRVQPGGLARRRGDRGRVPRDHDLRPPVGHPGLAYPGRHSCGSVERWLRARRRPGPDLRLYDAWTQPVFADNIPGMCSSRVAAPTLAPSPRADESRTGQEFSRPRRVRPPETLWSNIARRHVHPDTIAAADPPVDRNRAPLGRRLVLRGHRLPDRGRPPGCSVWTDIGGGPITTWYEEDDGLGRILEVEWDASWPRPLADRRPGAETARPSRTSRSCTRSSRRNGGGRRDVPDGALGRRQSRSCRAARRRADRGRPPVPLPRAIRVRAARLAAAGHDVHADFDGSAWVRRLGG